MPASIVLITKRNGSSSRANSVTMPFNFMSRYIMTTSNKSRRLRKKLYLDEFSVLGFEFSASLAQLQEEQFENFFDALLEFVESQQLVIGGGGSIDNFEGYIMSKQRYQSATDSDREALKSWLTQQPGITDINVAELSNAYYDEA